MLVEVRNEQEELNNSSNPEEEKKKLKEPSKWWVTLILYLICSLIAFGVVMLSLSLRDVFKGGLDKLTLLRYLADAFTFPAAIFISIGLLTLISRQGAFNGLLYALRHVGRMFVPFLVRKDITYAEYLERRERKKTNRPILCFFVVGGVSLLVAVIFIIIFTANGG